MEKIPLCMLPLLFATWTSKKLIKILKKLLTQVDLDDILLKLSAREPARTLITEQ